MPQEGFLQQRRMSPLSLAVVIALHGAAVTALMLAKGGYTVKVFDTLDVRNIPDEPPPPPEQLPPPPKEEVRQKTVIDQVTPLIKTERPAEMVLERQPEIVPVFDPGPVGDTVVEPVPMPISEPKPEPRPEPVRKEATMLASSELQPPYPASEQRAQNEGSVTVRIVIGTDGRVKSVEKVRGASEAFYQATQQQALRHWRFKPATLDGKPVESTKVLTVHFRLLA